MFGQHLVSPTSFWLWLPLWSYGINRCSLPSPFIMTFVGSTLGQRRISNVILTTDLHLFTYVGPVMCSQFVILVSPTQARQRWSKVGPTLYARCQPSANSTTFCQRWPNIAMLSWPFYVIFYMQTYLFLHKNKIYLMTFNFSRILTFGQNILACRQY